MNVRALRRQGVPSRSIHVLDTPIVNTADELDMLSAALQSKGGQRIIVGTNRAHARRVHLLSNKYYSSRGELIVHAVSHDDYQPDQWWKNHRQR